MKSPRPADFFLVRPQDYSLPHPFKLENGHRLSGVTVRYETYGRLNEARSNAILLHHAFSGDAHAAGYHTERDAYPGWWDIMVGPGKAFDTEKYFFVCSNVLGGCMGTTGPSTVDPATGTPYGMGFPALTIGDMVNLQKDLLDHLGIERLLAVAGGSMGGMQSLEWAVRYPDRVRGCLCLASTPRLTAQGIAFHAVGRNAIVSDPHWNEGAYYGREKPSRGLAIARMIGHITYLSDESMRRKFGRKVKEGGQDTLTGIQFEVEGYLNHQGQKFVDRFDANSYIYLTRAMDFFDLGQEYGGLAGAFSRARAKFLVVSFSSDWLFPTYQSKEMVMSMIKAGRDVSFSEIVAPYGHDSFLLETGQQARIISSFLGGLDAA